MAPYVNRDRLNPIVPSHGSSIDITPQLDVVRFGNNYIQVMESSAQRQLRRIRLTFTDRTTVIIRALRRFFDGEQGNTIYNRLPSEYFLWSPPDPFANTNGLPTKWMVLEKYSITSKTYNSWTLDVSLEEVFNP